MTRPRLLADDRATPVLPMLDSLNRDRTICGFYVPWWCWGAVPMAVVMVVDVLRGAF
jgi:hypothetical protein